MMLKMKCFGALAGCALATGSLCAATYSESFEGELVTTPATWAGGTATTSNCTYNAAVGRPLTNNVTNAKVYVVEGEATCTATASTFTDKPLVDMLVQVAIPDEPLELPDSDPVHIAVAVDTNGHFNVFCKNKAGVTNWYEISSATYTDGDWARVSLLFDYGNNRCQVRIDGQPIMSEYGYLLADTAADGDKASVAGAWYTLATDTTASFCVSFLKVVGCTAVDDVVLNNDSGAAEAYPTSGAVADGVPCSWYDKYGISWNGAAEAYDGTGMTIAQKYNACLEPLDGQTFEVKSVEVKNGVTKVGIPATVDTVGRKVVLQSSEDSSFPNTDATTTTDVDPGQTEVEVALPAAGSVKYFRLRAMDK